MEVVGKVNGEKIQRDPYDLDYLEIDVVKDYVRTIEHEESNPSARIEIDMTYPEKPEYRLVDCSDSFKHKFHELVEEKRKIS